MTATVRPLQAGDEAQWRRLWQEYLAFYQTEVPEAVYRTTFGRLLDPGRPGQIGFVAEKENHLMGLVHVIYHAHNWRIEEVCYLQDLYVAPAARGLGVGRELIEAVYAEADANGTPSVYWLTQSFNRQARQLYDRIATLSPFVKYTR